MSALKAYRPGNVDLPEATIVANATSIDDPRFFGRVLPDYDFPELAETAFAQRLQFNNTNISI